MPTSARIPSGLPGRRVPNHVVAYCITLTCILLIVFRLWSPNAYSHFVVRIFEPLWAAFRASLLQLPAMSTGLCCECVFALVCLQSVVWRRIPHTLAYYRSSQLGWWHCMPCIKGITRMQLHPLSSGLRSVTVALVEPM